MIGYGNGEDGSSPSQNSARRRLASRNSNSPRGSASPRPPSSASISYLTSILGATPTDGDDEIRRLKTDIFAIIQLKKYFILDNSYIIDF